MQTLHQLASSLILFGVAFLKKKVPLKTLLSFCSQFYSCVLKSHHLLENNVQNMSVQATWKTSENTVPFCEMTA